MIFLKKNYRRKVFGYFFYFSNGVHTAHWMTQQPFSTSSAWLLSTVLPARFKDFFLNLHCCYELAYINSSSRYNVSGSLEGASGSAFHCLQNRQTKRTLSSLSISEARHDHGDEAVILWPLATSLREMSYHTTELFKQDQSWENELNCLVFYYLQCNKS